MEEVAVAVGGDAEGFPGGELGDKGGCGEGEGVGEGDRLGGCARGEVGCVVFFEVGAVAEGGERGGAEVEVSGGEWREVLNGIRIHGHGGVYWAMRYGGCNDWPGAQVGWVEDDRLPSERNRSK